MDQYVYICKKCHMHAHTLYPTQSCRYCHRKKSLELIGVFNDQNLAQRRDIENKLDHALRNYGII